MKKNHHPKHNMVISNQIDRKVNEFQNKDKDSGNYLHKKNSNYELIEKIHTHQQQLQASHIFSTMGLWMILDGIGLALITASTLLEGIDLWGEIFHRYWSFNKYSLLLWFGGRSLQISGLLLLIAFASSFQMYPILEEAGMVLLTVGPILNLISCFLFDFQKPSFNSFHRQWGTSETLELIGISILDISMIEMDDLYVFLAEASGFFVLAIVSIIEFQYENDTLLPEFDLKLDMIHTSECFGLFLLCFVAYGQYRIHIQRQDLSLPHYYHTHYFSGNSTSSSTNKLHSAIPETHNFDIEYLDEQDP